MTRITRTLLAATLATATLSPPAFASLGLEQLPFLTFPDETAAPATQTDTRGAEVTPEAE